MKSNPWTYYFRKGGNIPKKDGNKLFCNYKALTNDIS